MQTRNKVPKKRLEPTPLGVTFRGPESVISGHSPVDERGPERSLFRPSDYYGCNRMEWPASLGTRKNKNLTGGKSSGLWLWITGNVSSTARLYLLVHYRNVVITPGSTYPLSGAQLGSHPQNIWLIE